MLGDQVLAQLVRFGDDVVHPVDVISIIDDDIVNIKTKWVIGIIDDDIVICVHSWVIGIIDDDVVNIKTKRLPIINTFSISTLSINKYF